MNLCAVSACAEPSHCKGYCMKHYTRWRRHGDPTVVLYRGPQPGQRRGPYRRAGGQTSYEERQRAYAQPRSTCKCGCGEATEWNASRLQWKAFAPGHKAIAVSSSDVVAAYESGLTIRQIAFDIGVGDRRISKILRENNVTLRSHSETIGDGRFAGPNNPAWKGGVTPERQRLYKTKKWRQLVAAVYQRDAHRCVLCGIDDALHAHHIRPWSIDPSRREDITNLVTVCRTCHSWIHSRANEDSVLLDLSKGVMSA